MIEGGYSDTSKPIPENSPVAGAMDRLEKAIAVADEEAHSSRRSLETVMRPAEIDQGAQPGTAQQEASPLVERIHSFADDVSRITVFMEQTRNMVEL